MKKNPMKKVVMGWVSGVVITLCGGGLVAGESKPTATIEPSVFGVYEKVSFKIRIKPGKKLGPGSKIECQLPNSFTNDKVSPSKVKQWQTDDPAAPHYINVTAGPPAKVTFKTEVVKREFVGGYRCKTRHGKCLIAEVVSGEIPSDGEVVVSYSNTTSSWLANQRPDATVHEGQVFVRVDGQMVEEFPKFQVRPGPMSYQRVIIPSAARPVEPFRVLLVSLDKYNNLSSSSFSDVSINCNETVLAGDISYTGRAEVMVSLPEEGIYRLAAGGITSNPIRISKHPKGPYWGDIHFHNFPSVDAMGNTPYEYARDVSGLDFAATAEHGAIGVAEHWAQTQKWCRQWHEPGRFVTILGFETNIRWHHNIYLYEDHAPIIESLKNGDSRVPIPALLDYLKGRSAITQLHHTGWGFDMRLRYPDTCKLIEIYSMHGLSELYEPENPLSFENQRHRPNSRVGPYYARDAWALGQRFFTHGSSDNHFGQAGVRYNSITGMMTDQLTRKAILDALSKGLCYATTGERILLDFRVNGRPMGSEFVAEKGKPLTFYLEVHGTDDLAEVSVFGCPFIEGDNRVPVGQLRFKEDDPLVEKARNSWATAFERKDLNGADFCESWTQEYAGTPMVYYVRVKQKNPIVLPARLEGFPTVQKRPVCAWSTPIWIRPE
jgi:hypothetical protein